MKANDKKNKELEKDREFVKSWKEFSMNPQSEASIRDRVLTLGIDSVCVSYICRFSKLSEEFIEELRILSTGILKRNDDLFQDNFISIKNGLERRAKFNSSNTSYEKLDSEKLGKIQLKSYGPNHTIVITEKAISGIRDRIDWTYISQYQVLSEEFIIKHEKDVHWGFIFKSQNLSKEFRKKYAHKVSMVNAPSEVEE